MDEKSIQDGKWQGCGSSVGKLINREEKRAERAHEDKHTLKLGAYKASDVA